MSSKSRDGAIVAAGFQGDVFIILNKVWNLNGGTMGQHAGAKGDENLSDIAINYKLIESG
jgi:hypothetical protein